MRDYFNRLALSPFLRVDGVFCPVRRYMVTGDVPTEDEVFLRQVGEKAATWMDPEVRAAGEHILSLLETK